MSPTVRSLRLAETLPRMLADYATVHFSMITALMISVFYHSSIITISQVGEEAAGLTRYYLSQFMPLSLLFPACLLLNGLYTHKRAYPLSAKILVVVRGVALSLLVFVTATFICFGGQREGRSAALPFGLLLTICLVATRVIKAQFEISYEVLPKISRNADKPILVLGGAGYIGSLLVRRLLQSGRKVRVFDRLMYGVEPIQDLLGDPQFEFMFGDSRNIQDVTSAMQGVGSIIDLAAIVGDPACEQDRQTALHVNFAATRMLIDLAKGQGIERFIFASSCSVYGAADYEMDEQAPARPISFYGQTKVDSEQALMNAASETFHPIVLRFATVFGLGHRPRFDLVVNLLVAKAFTEGVITIFNGEQWRPFIHVKDLAEGILRALEAPLNVVSGQIFNIGDPRLNYTLTDVAEKIREHFPKTQIERIQNSDRRNYRVNFTKAKRLLNFTASYTLDDGIREIKKALTDGVITDYNDLRYHNQRFIQFAGSPTNRRELDVQLMAAFGGGLIRE